MGARPIGQRSSALETLNGVRARVSRHEALYHGHLSGAVTSIFVRLPAHGFSISVSCGVSELPWRCAWARGPDRQHRPAGSMSARAVGIVPLLWAAQTLVAEPLAWRAPPRWATDEHEEWEIVALSP